MEQKIGPRGRSMTPFGLGAVLARSLRTVLPMVVAALVITVLLRRRKDGSTPAASAQARSDHRGHGSSHPARKMAVSLLIGVLENDMMRRAALKGLKVARDRM